MKKTSKIMSLVLAGAMVLSLGACSGGSTAETTKAAESTEAVTAPSSGEGTEASSEAGEGEGQTAEGTTYKIGILQLVQHTALDAANEGFLAALDEAGIQYDLDSQNASGDQSACQTVASKFANDKKDLILAIATPAAQAVAGAVTDLSLIHI